MISDRYLLFGHLDPYRAIAQRQYHDGPLKFGRSLKVQMLLLEMAPMGRTAQRVQVHNI